MSQAVASYTSLFGDITGAEEDSQDSRKTFYARYQEKAFAAGNRFSAFYTLNDEEIEFIKQEILAINGNLEDFVINSTKAHGTCFLASDNKVHIRGNILPDKSSVHPRDQLSPRAVLAHEYYGHKPFRQQYLREQDNPSEDEVSRIMTLYWADEFRASYLAAKNAPGLSALDRAMLIQDAISRAAEAGVTIRYNSFMKEVLYGEVFT